MRRFLVLAMAATLAACNADSTQPSGNIIGSYSLRTINGSSLPYTFSTGLTVTSDVLSLNSDGSFQDVSTYSNGTQQVESGFWANNNGFVEFTDNGGFSYEGSVSGDVLTESVSGYTQAYQRN